MRRLVVCLLVLSVVCIFGVLGAARVAADEPIDASPETIVSYYRRPIVPANNGPAPVVASAHDALLAMALVPLTCWLCVLVAVPRRPLRGNEVQELVYARLLRRHQRLMLLAAVMTAAVLIALVVSMPMLVIT